MFCVESIPPGAYAGLDRALGTALEPLRSRADPIDLLFSGGVDSSLLAWELRRHGPVTLVTVGRDGSPDLAWGERAARILELPWVGVRVDPEALHDTVVRHARELGGIPLVTRSVLATLASAIDRAPHLQLTCGQGIDELFLGYAHFHGLSSSEADRRVRDDLARLHEVDWPRTRSIATSAGRMITAPYLDPAFESAALAIPIELRLPRERPKAFFREWAVARGLPPELANRPKKAAQFGSGIDALLRSRGSGVR